MPREPHVSENNLLVDELRAIVGDDYVVHLPEDLIVFEYDGSVDKAMPSAVVLPASTEEVSAVVAAASRAGVPIVARGAGTGLSGGAVAEQGGLVVALTRMKRILEIDPANRLAVVEPGVVNLDISTAAAEYGLYFAPDPSSQRACTIGGNIAENSGGPHCLAYGVTTNHVLGMEVVLADGSVTWLGGRTRETPGYDLRGIVIGSEGTLAIATKIVVRLLKHPEAVKTLLAVFRELDQASSAVSGIIGAGIVPAAIEMMDHFCIEAVEPAVNAGYPKGAGAVLLVEVDGLREAVEEEAEEIERVCRSYEPMEIRTAVDEDERARLWAGRKGVLGALGRLAPNYYLVDGTIPGRGSWRCWPASPRSATSTISPSPTSCTRATATCTRRCSSTSATPTSSGAPWRRARTSLSCAWRPEGYSPESTGSAWRSRSTCRSCSATRTWRRWQSWPLPSGATAASTQARYSRPESPAPRSLTPAP